MSVKEAVSSLTLGCGLGTGGAFTGPSCFLLGGIALFLDAKMRSRRYCRVPLQSIVTGCAPQ